MTENLTPDALRAMLAAATPGPWKLGYASDVLRWNTVMALDERSDSLVNNPEICRLALPLGWRGGGFLDQESRGRRLERQADADATLIAAAPTALRLLLDVAEAAKNVSDLAPLDLAHGHRRSWFSPTCAACVLQRLVAALAALEGTPE